MLLFGKYKHFELYWNTSNELNIMAKGIPWWSSQWLGLRASTARGMGSKKKKKNYG